MMKTRTHKILEAIIRTYAELGNPVGSEFLLQKYQLGVSSATIRNIMAELEAQGVITHPHTSAGRVPTDHGYRYYVDLLMEPQRLLPQEDDQIESAADFPAEDPLDFLEHASRILSNLAQEAGVALMPQFIHGTFRRLDLIPLGSQEILAVLLSHEGLVKHGHWESEEPFEPEELKHLESFINQELSGMALSQASSYLPQLLRASNDPELARWKDSPQVQRLGALFQQEPSVILEGTSWVLEAPEFQDIQRTRRLIRGLEDSSELALILQRDLWAREVKLHIGSENRDTALVDCSIVAAPYRLMGGVMGTIGVLGPTRMDYPRVTGLVQRMAECVSQVMQQRWG